MADTSIDLGRPTQGDVIELILDDHRRFESLLRDLRDSTSDREAVRRALATLHTAHALAEEKHVYPRLRRRDAITEHEAEHGEEEHAEGHEAMLAVLELKGTDTQAFDDAVEELARVVNHHLTEEELTILNPAREEVGDRLRTELGEKFADRAQPADRRRLRFGHADPRPGGRGPPRGPARQGRRGEEAKRPEPGTARAGRRAAPPGRPPSVRPSLGSAADGVGQRAVHDVFLELPGALAQRDRTQVERRAGQPMRHRPQLAASPAAAAVSIRRLLLGAGEEVPERSIHVRRLVAGVVQPPQLLEPVQVQPVGVPRTGCQPPLERLGQPARRRPAW